VVTRLLENKKGRGKKNTNKIRGKNLADNDSEEKEKKKRCSDSSGTDNTIAAWDGGETAKG